MSVYSKFLHWISSSTFILQQLSVCLHHCSVWEQYHSWCTSEVHHTSAVFADAPMPLRFPASRNWVVARHMGVFFQSSNSLISGLSAVFTCWWKWGWILSCCNHCIIWPGGEHLPKFVVAHPVGDRCDGLVLNVLDEWMAQLVYCH